MKKKIVLIEDNPAMRENTAEILELSGYMVFSASNGKEGIGLVKKEMPDLVICDIMMPVMDGYEVLQALSGEETTSSIPFIFLTARAEKTDFRKGMEQGADDYLTKPFEDTQLLNAVNTRLHKTDILKKKITHDLEGLHQLIDVVQGTDQLTRLSAQKTQKLFKKKESIYTQGSYPKGIYFIHSGKVKTSLMNNDGKELITGLYNAGEFFGYLALLEETTYTDTAAPIEDAEISLVSKDDFYSLVYNSPGVSKKFIKMLSNNLADKETQLIKLAYNSVRKRVAEALLAICKKYSPNPAEKFSMRISRDNLSQLAGTSTETVIRTLSDFKEEGLVELKGGLVTIPDPQKLSMLKN